MTRESGDRRATCAPVRRTHRYLCVVMGRERTGVTRVHRSLERAVAESLRLVVERPDVDHVFVAHIVASAKLEVVSKEMSDE